jgi:reductive dehalogenase
MIIVAKIFGLILLLFFFYFGIVSIREKENRAAIRAFILAFILPIPYLLLPYMFGESANDYSAILISLSIISVIIVFFPFKSKILRENEIPQKRYDERDIMFSRKELIPGSDKFEDYYKKNPQKQKYDDKFRNKPGLLSNNANLYDQYSFAAAKATFKTVESYWKLIDKEYQLKEPFNLEARDITDFIEKWAKQLGVISIGITELKEYHLYSVKGRREKYGKSVEIDHKYAIAFTVEMDKTMMAYAPNGPTVMESAQQYLEAGTIAVQITEYIHELGYEAQAHIDGNYSVVCPLVARDAGLGEIGRMGLLMTPELGPRVRIGVVTTNVPLLTTSRRFDDSMIKFCEICKKCANACPPKAIPVENRKLENDVNRWKINSESCYTYWCTIGTDCGRCLSVCPYSHPDNFLHNLVRFGIRLSPVFRKFALKMDDFFYGRIPPPKTLNEINSFDYFK